MDISAESMIATEYDAITKMAQVRPHVAVTASPASSEQHLTGLVVIDLFIMCI
jgi:hypothetical protein